MIGDAIAIVVWLLLVKVMRDGRDEGQREIDRLAREDRRWEKRQGVMARG